MNNQEFYSFLDSRKQFVMADIQALSAEGRTDDANILKAKYNVYDIGKSVFDATLKQSGDTAPKAFPELFAKITGAWSVSLETAKAHGDDRKVLIEEAKLAAVAEINAKVSELF
ncbi:MAG: hypothetical protein IK055_04145 [Lachnospiraceae bacterium]|nr:hypothetical protein [Lachnospiraceae bacterium]